MSSACRRCVFTFGLHLVSICALTLFDLHAAAQTSTDDEELASLSIDEPLAPDQALDAFALRPGYRIELVAAEPQVVDPIAIRFDQFGRMWVVEMGDYPHGPPQGEPGSSRVRILEDRDQDGYFESATTFADKLLFPTGVQPWKNGAFVTLAGRVAFFADDDGDLVADRETTLFTGFAEENSQLRANHPTLGLDGRIYIANGLRGGQIVRADNPGEPLSISGMDFSFDPETLDFAAVSGGGQFGMTFDDAGRRFICSNRNPMMHVVIENRYSTRNPSHRLSSIKHDVAASGFESQIFPISRFWTTSNLHEGQFTAACGVMIHRGDALGDSPGTQALTCDPTGNLVHLEIMASDHATFRSTSPYDGVEFLASPDIWFRPVNLECGPDGALYVVDMYRAVIEHPQFVPEELKQRPDQRFGDDRGRIYRIIHEDWAVAPTGRSAHPTESIDLAKWLRHENGWHRDTALRLMYEDQSQLDTETLANLASEDSQVATRIAAMWLLHRRGELTDKQVIDASHDSDDSIRETALLFMERANVASDEMIDRVVAMSLDPSPRVRFQCALTLGMLKNIDANTKADALLSIGRWSDVDAWTEDAILLAAHDVMPQLNTRALAEFIESEHETKIGAGLVSRMARQSARQSDFARISIWGQLLAVQDRELRLRLIPLMADIAEVNVGEFRRLDRDIDDDFRESLIGFIELAREVAQDTAQPTALRISSIRLLACQGDSESSLLQDLSWSHDAVAVRRTAMQSMVRISGTEFWLNAVERFSAESPPIRAVILDGLFSNPARTRVLLDALDAGHIVASEIDATRRQRLLRHSDADIRERAQRAIAQIVSTDREQVLNRYRTALDLDGDPEKGRALFAQHCANCHRIDTLGVDIAPDISDSRVKSKIQLLTDILQPNLAIDAGYISYIVETVDGRVLTGVIDGETPSTLTLKQPEGKSDTLLRSEIETMTSTRKSLMPEGLENDLTIEAMADLISFIKNWRYLDGRTPADGLPVGGRIP